MTPVIAIGKATVGQILPWRRFLGLGALANAPALLVFLVTSADQADEFETFVGITAGLFFGVAMPIVSLVLATASLGDERRDETLSFIALKPIPRAMIALAKILASVAAATAVLATGAVTLGVARGIRTGEWEYVLPLLVAAIVGALVYASLFTPLGYLTQRATLSGLAYVFIWEGAVVGALPALASTSAWRVAFSAFAALVPEEVASLVGDFALGSVVPGAGGAVVKALVVVAVATLLTTWILRRRDLA